MNFLERERVTTVTLNGQDLYEGEFLYYLNENSRENNLKIRVRSVALFNGDNSKNIWSFATNFGAWSYTEFEFDNYGNQYFTSTSDGLPIKISFAKGNYTFSFYEPGEVMAPVFTKRLIVKN